MKLQRVSITAELEVSDHATFAVKCGGRVLASVELEYEGGVFPRGEGL